MEARRELIEAVRERYRSAGQRLIVSCNRSVPVPSKTDGKHLSIHRCGRVSTCGPMKIGRTQHPDPVRPCLSGSRQQPL